MIALEPDNQVIMTSATTQLAPSPQPSTILRGDNFYVRFVYTPQKIYNHTQGQVAV